MILRCGYCFGDKWVSQQSHTTEWIQKKESTGQEQLRKSKAFMVLAYVSIGQLEPVNEVSRSNPPKYIFQTGRMYTQSLFQFQFKSIVGV